MNSSEDDDDTRSASLAHHFSAPALGRFAQPFVGMRIAIGGPDRTAPSGLESGNVQARDAAGDKDSSGRSMSLPFLNTAPGYDEELPNGRALRSRQLPL